MASIQMCHFSGLAEIAKSIFGSSESQKKVQPENLIDTGSLEGDVAAIKAMLRF